MLVQPQRAYHKTTDSHHRFRRHPNLLKAGPAQVVPTGPEQVWVADITYCWGEARVTSTPSNLTLPCEGTSRPDMMLSMVVLPQPVGPSKA